MSHQIPDLINKIKSVRGDSSLQNYNYHYLTMLSIEIDGVLCLK